MSPNRSGIEWRLKVSGTLIALGLMVELFSLIWSHPTAFLFFILLGGSLMVAGIIFYLYSLVTGEHHTAVRGDQT
jgi:hypothetical protein